MPPMCRARAEAARRRRSLPRLSSTTIISTGTILKTDRARAAYDIFHPLDGQFDDNVIVQIKNGPIDFQVREPASPLFAGLDKTNEAIELQITQEYTGPAAPPLSSSRRCGRDARFRHARGRPGNAGASRSSRARAFHRPLGGFVGVANVGLDADWLGHPLAHGESLWLRPPGLESRISARSKSPTNGRGSPSATIPQSSQPIDSDATRLVAHRTRTTPARSALQTLTDITRQPLRPRIEVCGAQRLGPMASRRSRRASAWIAPSPPAPATSGNIRPPVAKHLRVARNLPRQSAALLASRSVYVPAALRQDRHPVHLRFALQGAGEPQKFVAAVGIAARAASTTSVMQRRPRAASNIRPAMPSSGATPVCELVPARYPAFPTQRIASSIIRIA